MVIYNKRLEFFHYFYIEILRAPSMCGHKDTKIFLKNFFAFYRLLFTSLLLPGASIQSDPSGPRDTSRRAIKKTDNSTDFIFRTRSFVSEAALCLRK